MQQPPKKSDSRALIEQLQALLTGTGMRVEYPRDDYGFVSPYRKDLKDRIAQNRGKLFPDREDLDAAQTEKAFGFLYADRDNERYAQDQLNMARRVQDELEARRQAKAKGGR